jgi:hypothetical protein
MKQFFGRQENKLAQSRAAEERGWHQNKTRIQNTKFTFSVRKKPFFLHQFEF